MSSYAVLVTGNTTEPLYIVKIIEKGKANENIYARYDHIIFPGEYYLKGQYLVKAHSKSINKRQFKILENPVLMTAYEIFEHDDLMMDTYTYLELVERALI